MAELVELLEIGRLEESLETEELVKLPEIVALEESFDSAELVKLLEIEKLEESLDSAALVGSLDTVDVVRGDCVSEALEGSVMESLLETGLLSDALTELVAGASIKLLAEELAKLPVLDDTSTEALSEAL